MNSSTSSASLHRRLALLVIGALSLSSVACSSAVWVQNNDKAKPQTYYLMALIDAKDFRNSETYRALKRDDVLAAVSTLEASLKADADNKNDRNRLAVLYEICGENEMAIKLLREGAERAAAKNDKSGKESFERDARDLEKRSASKH